VEVQTAAVAIPVAQARGSARQQVKFPVAMTVLIFASVLRPVPAMVGVRIDIATQAVRV
jgi:hypothetical protein